MIPSIIFMPQVLAMAELVSSMPVNGAFYSWTAVLAPARMARFLSFSLGWVTILIFCSSVASFAFAVSSTLIQAITFVQPSWIPTSVQHMGLANILVMLWISLAMLKMENAALVYIFCSSYPLECVLHISIFNNANSYTSCLNIGVHHRLYVRSSNHSQYATESMADGPGSFWAVHELFRLVGPGRSTYHMVHSCMG